MEGSRGQEQEVGFEQGECIGLSLCEDMRGFVVEGRPAQEHDCEEGAIEGSRGCRAVVAGELDIPAQVEEHDTQLSCGRLLWKGVRRSVSGIRTKHSGLHNFDNPTWSVSGPIVDLDL